MFNRYERTCFPSLIIEPGCFEIVESYSGEVIADISGPSTPPKLTQAAVQSV